MLTKEEVPEEVEDDDGQSKGKGAGVEGGQFVMEKMASERWRLIFCL